MTDSDTDNAVDNYESCYMAYGLFGILMRWAKSGYHDAPQALAAIVTDKIFGNEKKPSETL